MGELTKALTELLTRLDQLPMSVKAGWLVWITVGAVLLQWRRVARNRPVWLPPTAPRQIRGVEPVVVQERRRRSRHTTLSISPAAS
jgi:hypothetical protein